MVCIFTTPSPQSKEILDFRFSIFDFYGPRGAIANRQSKIENQK